MSDISKFLVKMKAVCNLIRNRMFDTSLKFKNTFRVECVGADGKVKWTQTMPNGVTTVGLNQVLDTYLRVGGTNKPAGVCIGLIDNSGYGGGIQATDTMAAHGGWLEATGYSNANRVNWGPIAAAAGVMTNTTPAAFNINATQTIKGIFVVTDPTLGNANNKGGTTGTLFAHAMFSGGDQAVVNGDTLNVTYTVTLT